MKWASKTLSLFVRTNILLNPKCVTFLFEIFNFSIHQNLFSGEEKSPECSLFIQAPAAINISKTKTDSLGRLLVKLRENTCKHHTPCLEVIASHNMVSRYNIFIILRDATLRAARKAKKDSCAAEWKGFCVRNDCLFCWFNEPFIVSQISLKS